MAVALELNAVSQTYAKKQVLHGVTLLLECGSALTLLGPNGAGKSTLVSLIAGMEDPVSGSIQVLNGSPRDPNVRQRVGCMFQDTTMIEKARVGEVIRLFRSYYAEPLDYATILALSGLKDEEHRYASTLSGGQTRRLQFAIAIAGDPDLLVLDEPTTGMDIDSRMRFWKQLQEYATEGKTVVLTTHDLSEAEGVTDRLAVLNRGALIADGRLQEMREGLVLSIVTFRYRQSLTDQALGLLGARTCTQLPDGRCELRVNSSDECLEAMFEQGLARAFGIHDIRVQGGGLQEVFKSILQSHSS